MRARSDGFWKATNDEPLICGFAQNFGSMEGKECGGSVITGYGEEEIQEP